MKQEEEEEIRHNERKPQPEHKQATKQEHLSLRSKPFLHQLWPSLKI